MEQKQQVFLQTYSLDKLSEHEPECHGFLLGIMMFMHFETFENEHNGTTKASQRRARAAIGEVKKLVTDYRKASVASDKA